MRDRSRKGRGWLPAIVVGCCAVALGGCAEADSGGEEDAAESTSVDRHAIHRQGEEAQASISSCMEERGFRVVLTDDGRTRYPTPEGEGGDEVLLQNLGECSAAADFPDPPPASRSELSGMYDLQLERIECLKESGYEPAPPPSREKYIEDRQQLDRAGGGVSWDPLDPRSLDADDDIMELQERCPVPQLIDL